MSSMDSINEFADWLKDTPVATFVQESEWAFQALETVHVLALTLVVGTIAIVDLRLLGLAWTDRPVTEIARDCLKWTWGSFAFALLTGGLMFSSNAVKYLGAFPFRMKLLFLLLAGLNMLVFQLITARDIADWDRDRPVPLNGKIAGALSLALWIGIVTFGRWTGFVINPF